MATPEETIKKQAEQIETLKKAISILSARVSRLESTERSIKSNITNNARDIRAVAVQTQDIRSTVVAIASQRRGG